MTPSATLNPTRGWWPRSLLGRNLLLMAVLIVLGQVVAAMLVRQMIFQPRVAQVADGVQHDHPPWKRSLEPIRRQPECMASRRLISMTCSPISYLIRPLGRTVLLTARSSMGSSSGS